MAACAVALLLAVPQDAHAEIPTGVEPVEVTAHQWDEPKTGGVFRSDGSSAYDKAGVYSPQPGDRFEVEYREGLRLSFFNVGEQGGEQYAEARIDFIREHLTPGLEVPRARPRVLGTPGPDAGGESEMVPAKGVLGPYEEPYYFLRFSGGPGGTFTQTGGYSQPDGAVTGRVVREPLDGLHYVELRPFYVRMRLDDPSAFVGWPGEKALPPGDIRRSQEDTSVAVRLIAYDGLVSLRYPNGTSATLAEEPSGRRLDKTPVGTVVTTSADSFLEMEFANGERYIIGPRSVVELLQREANGARLRRGSALVWYPKGLPPASSRTAVGHGLVEGSGVEWVLEEEPRSSGLTVLAGSATLSVPGTSGQVRLETGQKATATERGIGTVQRVDAESVRLEWKELRAEGVSLGQGGPLSVPGVLPGVILLLLALAAGALMFWRKARSERGISESAQ